MSALAGRRIVVTRARAQAAVLGDQLSALGATPLYLPTIEIAPLEDYAALDAALRQLEAYAWVLFTSANGVAAVCGRLAALGVERWPRVAVAAIGPGTAEALAAHGLTAAYVPETHLPEALAAGLGDVRGQRVLLPAAALARETLAQALTERGAQVEAVAAYRTRPAAPDPAVLAKLRRGVDAITFTSASTVRSFAAQAGPELAALTQQAVIACLGPITADAAREAGLRVDLVAEPYTTAGLVAALAAHFARSAEEAA